MISVPVGVILKIVATATHTVVAGAAIGGGPVEIAVGGFHQGCDRIAIAAVEAAQRGQRTAGVILKIVPQPLVPPEVVVP